MSNRIGKKAYSLRVDKLKNIEGLSEINFIDKSITGIFGPNCCGKSTILHALACCYQPPAGTSNFNYRFSYFFLPNTDALWSGSRITLTHKYMFQGSIYDGKMTDYEKHTTQWKPRYDKRPERHVSYIGIKSCVPMIEKEQAKYKISYTTNSITSVVANQTLEALGKVFNRSYEALNEHISSIKTYRGLSLNGLQYSSLSMGAGEQRLLHILSEVFSCPRYGLILIDEFDLLMHGDALRRCLDVISKRVKEKEIQVVFTSHRERLLESEDIINIRHIHNTNNVTYCFNDSNLEAMHRLTGRRERPIEVFVEDDLATAIINKITGIIGIRKIVKTNRFGSAVNAFTIAAAMCLREECFENTLFVLDGDVYRTQQKKIERINAVLTGTSHSDGQKREKVLDSISQLSLPENICPEEYVHKMLIEIDPQLLDDESREIVDTVREVVHPLNKHDYISNPIQDLGYGKPEGYQRVIDIAAKSPLWNDYTISIENWLRGRQESLMPNNANIAEND